MDKKPEVKKEGEAAPPPVIVDYVHESAIDRLNMNENIQGYNDVKDYFFGKYGDLKALPTALLTPDKINRISKAEMIEAAGILNLDASETGLFWIAQMLYLLPIPTYWALKRNPAEKAGAYFVYKEKSPSMYPPCILYLDYLIETIRKNGYLDLDKSLKSKYYYEDDANDRLETYTDDDIIAGNFDGEKIREKRFRPSLRKFWYNWMISREEARLYRKFEIEQPVVYNANEKGPASAYTNYQATGTIEEQKMEQFWLDKANRQLAEKRETEEFIHFMKDWSSAKQRYESEIIRKNGQAYSGSNFEKRAFRLTSKVTYNNPRQYSAQSRAITGMAASKVPQSTAAGTATINRPLTGTTVYMHSNKIAPNTIYRKTSSRNFADDYRKKLQSGGYREQNKLREEKKKADESVESSVEIAEDKDELDQNNEDMLEEIDNQVKKGFRMNTQDPQLIDASGKAARAIRTATYTDKKDIKHVDSALTLTNQQSVDTLIHLEENKISQTRLKQVRSAHKFISSEPIEEFKKTDTNLSSNNSPVARPAYRTMSVYGNKTKNLEVNDRPFTAVLETDILKFGRNNDLREIDNIKKRLNKYEIEMTQIIVPLKKIETALVPPEINPIPDMSKFMFPKAGGALLSNPAFEKKKKKKKGKKAAGKKKSKR